MSDAEADAPSNAPSNRTAGIETVRLSPAQERARRKRSVALAFVLGALAVLFFVATVDKFGTNLVHPSAIRDL